MSLSKPPRTGRRAIVLLVPALLMGAGIVRAGTLSVEGAATHAGTYGLRATVGTCASPDDVVVTDPSLGGPAEIEACETLTTSGTVVVSTGGVTFRAGRTIGLGNGFSVSPGASFNAQIAPGIYRPAYVQDDSPASEKVYRAQFYARFDGLTLADGTSFDHFDALRADGMAELRLRFKRNETIVPAENRLVVDARLDGGGYASNEGLTEIAVPAGWHKIEVVWKAATAAGANNGSVSLIFDDGMSQNVLTALDNDQGAIDFVRWGAVGVPAASSVAGFMDLDEFTSSRMP